MNSPTNETQDITETLKNQQPAKYTTLRVLRTKRNKIRRIAERQGYRVEHVTDILLSLGLERFSNS